MLPIMFLILAGYAVRCDNTRGNNYVIEMPDDRDAFRKPFDVYWNVPTMQCRSKSIPFGNLHEKFGIIQNTGDSFRGDKIAILYDPGLFPALLKNETSGHIKFRNGGVPQEGNLEKHLEVFSSFLNQSIPDPDFNGIGIIDFESWRPVFRQNFGVLVPYKDVSYEIERKRHWWWMDDWIKTEARARFEQSARSFMSRSLSLARRLRPAARWGYYGFPYCFNGGSSTDIEHCSKEVREENDRSSWLWSASSALFPSVYSSASLPAPQLPALLRGRVKEAARVARGNTPILPYFWFRYRDGGFLTQRDLKAALQTFYKSNASGFIIWGSSGDVNSVEKCNKLLAYINDVMGPAIAKYTKSSPKIDNYPIDSDIQSDDGNRTEVDTKPGFIDNNEPTSIDEIANNSTQTTTVSEVYETIRPEPENLWHAPENYAQDIVRYVEEEFHKKSGNNLDSLVKKINESVLLEVITKALNEQVHVDREVSHTNEKSNKYYVNGFYTTTEVNIDDQTTNFNGENIDSEYSIDKFDLQSNKSIDEEYDTTEKYSTTETYNISTTYTDNYNTQQTESYEITSNSDNQPYLFNVDTLIKNDEYTSTTELYNNTTKMYTLETELTTSVDVDNTKTNNNKNKSNYLKDIKKNILQHKNHVSRHSRMFVNKDIDDISIKDVFNSENENGFNETVMNNNFTKNGKKDIINENSENETQHDLVALSYNATSQELNSASAHRVRKHHFFICFFFYFYSMSRCLCDFYQYCT